MREQFLDMHPLERERGITIKMQPVRMIYHMESLISKPESLNKLKSKNSKNPLEIRDSRLETADSKQEIVLNLIDTPGHVDFTYEVSRALAAVEGAVLLVDATQGVQAQTLANLQLAQKAGLEIVPALNKVDLSSAETDRVAYELSKILDILPAEFLRVSAKYGTGVEELLKKIVIRVPAPAKIEKQGGFQALIFDSVYDSYQGVIAYIRIFEGEVSAGDKIDFLATKVRSEVKEVGIFSPERKPALSLLAGEIGYIVTGIKEPDGVRVGDTITKLKIKDKDITKALPGYQEPRPVVYASVFPENQDDYEEFKEALKKLKLNDAAVNFEMEGAQGSLGRGFRMGFLGTLHMEITAERLKREYGLGLIFSNPSVSFRVFLHHKPGYDVIYSPTKLPETRLIKRMEEPWAKLKIVTPTTYLGGLNNLLRDCSGRVLEMGDLAGGRIILRAEAPLREVILDFYDKLKSVSQGFASVAYELADYRPSDLVKMDVLVAGERMPLLSEIVPREKVYFLAREKLSKLKGLLPRELFAIALQVEVEGRIIARETIPALRKDVTGYLYGGDRTRKMKLWKKQQKGKKRLLESAKVEISPEVFLKMIKRQ